MDPGLGRALRKAERAVTTGEEFRLWDRYLIIADDFTGANDTGVQLRRRGIPTEVVFAGKPIGSDEASIVIDTESRTILSETAGKIVRNALKGVDFSPFKYVMKKIDSSIRGNIVEETKAVLEYFKPEIIVCAPALPVLGRTTVRGIQLLNGVRILDTEVAIDPINPVIDDDLVSILGKICGEKPTLKTLDDVRSDGFNLEGGKAFVCDAETNADLSAIVAATIKTGKKALYIGTAGIAESIMDVEHPVLPAFAVVASVSSVTNKQMQHCGRNGAVLIQVPIGKILTGEVKADELGEKALASLERGDDTILLTDTAYDRSTLKDSLEAFGKLGLSAIEAGEKVRTIMGELALGVLERTKVSGVFLSGGDTALGLMRKLGAEGADILSEAITGIPLTRVHGGKFHGLKLATKAGAYGNEDAVSLVMRKLKETI